MTDNRWRIVGIKIDRATPAIGSACLWALIVGLFGIAAWFSVEDVGAPLPKGPLIASIGVAAFGPILYFGAGMFSVVCLAVAGAIDAWGAHTE